MSKTKDVATVVINRGATIGKAGEMAGLFLQYRMDEIVNKYNIISDDFFYRYRNKDNPFRIKYEKQLSDAGGPSKYILSGSLAYIGMNQMWQAVLGEVMVALDYASPFLTGSRINPHESTVIRAPWFQSHPDHGIKANITKNMEVHRVGKCVRLGNGQGPMLDVLARFLEDEGPTVPDTQIDEIWTVGEPTAARKLASAIRQKCLQYGGTITNSELLGHIYACTSYKAVALVKDFDDDVWPWQVSYDGSFIPDEKDQFFINVYNKNKGRWFLCDTDPLNVDIENGVDPLVYAGGPSFDSEDAQKYIITPKEQRDVQA